MAQPVQICITSPGQLLTAYRKRAQITQRALADLLGSHEKSVHNWESDLTKPDAETWSHIAKILSIPPEDALQIWRN